MGLVAMVLWSLQSLDTYSGIIMGSKKKRKAQKKDRKKAKRQIKNEQKARENRDDTSNKQETMATGNDLKCLVCGKIITGEISKLRGKFACKSCYSRDPDSPFPWVVFPILFIPLSILMIAVLYNNLTAISLSGVLVVSAFVWIIGTFSQRTTCNRCGRPLGNTKCACDPWIEYEYIPGNPGDDLRKESDSRPCKNCGEVPIRKTSTIFESLTCACGRTLWKNEPDVSNF